MDKRKNLPRLPLDCYQGRAIIHWTISIQDRKTGWLNHDFHFHFREILLHSLIRYQLACSIYCLMPDHLHLLLHGRQAESCQKKAIRFLKRFSSPWLKRLGFDYQAPFDHVLRQDEHQAEGLAKLVDYISRNPERKGLVGRDEFAAYPFSGSMIAGWPLLSFKDEGFWTQFAKCVK